jgi:hypothetical protein
VRTSAILADNVMPSRQPSLPILLSGWLANNMRRKIVRSALARWQISPTS